MCPRFPGGTGRICRHDDCHARASFCDAPGIVEASTFVHVPGSILHRQPGFRTCTRWHRWAYVEAFLKAPVRYAQGPHRRGPPGGPPGAMSDHNYRERPRIITSAAGANSEIAWQRCIITRAERIPHVRSTHAEGAGRNACPLGRTKRAVAKPSTCTRGTAPGTRERATT